MALTKKPSYLSAGEWAQYRRVQRSDNQENPRSLSWELERKITKGTFDESFTKNANALWNRFQGVAKGRPVTSHFKGKKYTPSSLDQLMADKSRAWAVFANDEDDPSISDARWAAPGGHYAGTINTVLRWTEGKDLSNFKRLDLVFEGNKTNSLWGTDAAGNSTLIKRHQGRNTAGKYGMLSVLALVTAGAALSAAGAGAAAGGGAGGAAGGATAGGATSATTAGLSSTVPSGFVGAINADTALLGISSQQATVAGLNAAANASIAAGAAGGASLASQVASQSMPWSTTNTLGSAPTLAASDFASGGGALAGIGKGKALGIAKDIAGVVGPLASGKLANVGAVGRPRTQTVGPEAQTAIRSELKRSRGTQRVFAGGLQGPQLSSSDLYKPGLYRPGMRPGNAPKKVHFGG